MEKNQSDNTISKNKNEDKSSKNVYSIETQQKVNEILTKWLDLQKIIKEEITLKEIIKKQQEDGRTSFQNLYFEYYSKKLETRENFENVKKIDDGEYQELVNFKLASNVETCLSDAYDPTKKLLIHLRNNYDYILKIVQILDESEEVRNESDTLVDLLCHQFYDNILIPNPDQEELLILCYLLLEREVSSMNSASVSSFIDETSSFVGKFLKSYTKKQELKSYLSMALGSLILSIENMNETCLDLNPSQIHQYLKQKGAHYAIEDKTNKFSSDFLTTGIPKCTININKDIILQEEEDEIIENDRPSIGEEELISKNNTLNVNEDYSIEINQEELNNRIQIEKDEDLKQFYIRQLERITKDPDIFTNKKFEYSLQEFGDNKMRILKKYKENFLIVRSKIDCIIQSLIDKITTIPYTLRCICKIIHILILKKFDRINSYERNAFIGEFIFGKCILPILINSDINAIITTTILSFNTRQCLKIIAKVLTTINRGYLFEANIDTDFTVFNHYIIEVIPLINMFYSKLIDVQLPGVLDNFIKERMKNSTLFSKTIRVRGRSFKKEDNSQSENAKPMISYNYFDKNPDETSNIQCICFSIEDILLLIKKIRPRMKDFKYLPSYSFFEKTIDRIYNEEHKFGQVKRRDDTMRNFYLVYKEEKNTKFAIHKDDDAFFLSSDNNQDSELFLKGMKFCIKNVLKGLNLINKKDYSYLNLASSTNNFFLALKATLEDIEDYSNSFSTEIPLKWYSQYISNNKKMLSEEYKQNDFQKLYDELLKEEQQALKTLINSNSIVMTRNGMNVRCAEKIIEKAKRDNFRIEQIKNFMKMAKFINDEVIGVKLQRRGTENLNNVKVKEQSSGGFWLFSKDKEKKTNAQENNKEESESILEVIPLNSNEKRDNRKNSKREKVESPNCWTVKEFIKKLSKFKEIKEDVISGKQNNKIYDCIQEYLNIIKVKFDQPGGIFCNDTTKENQNTLDRIESHIMKKLYQYVFPKEPLEKDIEFYKKTLSLKWITPAHLEIKKVYVNELKSAGDLVKKIDEGKSVYEKLEYIHAAHNTINNTIKFSSGKDLEVGAEELSPLFQYIIIKARPKRFFSNIYYIRAFLHPSKLKGRYGFLLTQMEFAAEYISKIDHTHLKMTKEEYDSKVNEGKCII